MSATYRSHGKLLLTGEYAVLDGAEALGLPARFGQTLDISEGNTPGLLWKSLDHEGKTWFETEFHPGQLDPKEKDPSGDDTRDILQGLLREAVRLNPDFNADLKGIRAVAQLEFPRIWGLGSSSTLINNIAQWAGVDPYILLWNAFGGSGYDIACARATGPLIYKVQDRVPVSEPVPFNPPFHNRLYFVHLNRKQSSREAIAMYRKNVRDHKDFLEEISGISREMATCTNWESFTALIEKHETLLAGILEMERIQDQIFPDFDGIVKSLGAWGGDFVLAGGEGDIPSYFKAKGYKTVLSYRDMVL
ncbi:GYDIA family GHMP kinase [Muriicola marianensis]|uniref:GHMP kinase n=1 Tax=Muriicola marianensis TaxID=1324801 RepID=A0ABQ1R0F5_9FLAO|nr:GYDIA family GHMP kinase [Muriicola marianensis]GGD53745.1 hypothetical protein GCM10011361_20540 [Muriicola marianensis]